MRRAATHTQTLLLVALSTAGRRDSRADPATRCLRHSTVASPAPVAVAASLCVRARRRAACTAVQRQQIWRSLHRHAWSRCNLQGTEPSAARRYQQYRRVKRPRSGVGCRSDVRPATGAVQALSHASTHRTLPQPIMGRRRGVPRGQGAEPPNYHGPPIDTQAYLRWRLLLLPRLGGVQSTRPVAASRDAPWF